MKVIYIYNPHVAKEVNILERIQNELGNELIALDVFEISSDLKQLVQTTPALIIAPNYLQGAQLLEESENSELLVIAEIYQKIEQDDLHLYQQKTDRLDNFIICKQNEAKKEAETKLNKLGKQLVKEKLNSAKLKKQLEEA